MKLTRYDELKIGDVILFHGGKCRIISLKSQPHFYKGFAGSSDVSVSFEIEPFDDECIEILGSFYSHGCYGGVGCLEVYVL